MHSCILSYIVLHVFKAQIWIWSNSANRKNLLHDKVIEINKFVNEPYLLNIFCITRFIYILIQNKIIVKKKSWLCHILQTEKQNTELYDSAGKSVEASLVLEHSIRYLKTYIIRELRKYCFYIQYADIDYVFTVPDTRGEKAKALIREAAINVCYNTLAWVY